jgi:hypothetical protein
MAYAESDLTFNRAGSLSPTQKAILMRGWKKVERYGVVFLVLIVGLGVFFQLHGELLGLIGMGIFAAFVLAVGGGLRLVVERIHRSGAVSVARGVIRREIEVDEGYEYYCLYVGALRLAMDASDYAQFEDGKAYTVYYVRDTKYVLSAETA